MGWGLDIFPKFAVKYPCPRANHSIQMKHANFPTPCCTSTQLSLVLFGLHDFQIFPYHKAHHEWSVEVRNLFGLSLFHRVSSQISRCIKERAKPELAAFCNRVVNSVLNLPEVKFFGKFKLQKNCNQCCLWKTFLGYLKRLLGYYILAATCPNGKP